MPTVRVAAVQAMPVVLDLQASLDKALRLLADAAGQGAQLVVFPETFLSLYPSYAWAHLTGGDGDALAGVVGGRGQVLGPVVDRIAAACREALRRRLRCGRQRTRARAPRQHLQHAVVDRSGRLAQQAPQAHADPSRTAVPRPRRGRRPPGHRDTSGSDRWADLLGEPDAAGPVGRIPGRPADLARSDSGRAPTDGRPRSGTSPSSPAPSSCRCPSSSSAPHSATTFLGRSRTPRSSAGVGRPSSPPRPARSSRGRCTTPRASSSPTATSGRRSTPSAGSTRRATTAAPTSYGRSRHTDAGRPSTTGVAAGPLATQSRS